MKKILRIIARLNVGGPAIHTVLLSSALNKDGYKDILVCGQVDKTEGDMSYFAEESGIKPIIIPEIGREISFWKDIVALCKLVALIKKEKPDIVHTHTAKAGALGRIAALLGGVPVKIHTFHGHIFDGYFHPVKARIFLYIERFLGLFTDKVIVVSENVRKEIVDDLKVVSGDKCVVVPLGLQLDEFLNDGPAKGGFKKDAGIDDGSLLVGIVGRLVPIKNHKMFLKVAKRVSQIGPDLKVKFIIVGDGELAGLLKNETKALGLENIIFTGWIKKLARVYADLDIVAITSLNEGTPVSVIEAQASAKPVIATDVGGVSDLIADGVNGFLVKSDDVEGFFRKLLDLLKDAAMRKEFGLAGRQFVKERYAKDRLVKDIKELYENTSRKSKL